MEDYVGNTIRFSDIDISSLNLIISSCGTGKSYFCANELLGKMFERILPEEVLFVTSRTLAADQQSSEYDTLVKLEKEDPITDYWSGCADIDNYATGTCYECSYGKTRIMTYDKIVSLLFGRKSGYYHHEALSNVKMIIFDEIHSIYSDLFVSGMSYLQMWLHYEILRGEKYFFGLTATPGVLLKHAELLGVNLNIINEPLYRFKARQLWCTDISSMLNLINNKLEGKTIIMCRSVKSCYALQKMIPKSVVLAGKSGKDYVPCDMDRIRDSIVNHSSLPDGVDVLISTSTAREGFTFKEHSGIKNVVCFYSDEMNIHQFMGRCRYDVDNLIIVDLDRHGNPDDYFENQELMFKDFCEDQRNVKWFDLISDSIRHRPENAIILLCKDKKKIQSVKKPKAENPSIGLFKTRDSMSILSDYIKSGWVTSFDDPDPDRIIVGHDTKTKIINDAKDMGIFANGEEDITWPAFEKVLFDLGFSVSNGRKYLMGKRVRYKTIDIGNGEL